MNNTNDKSNFDCCGNSYDELSLENAQNIILERATSIRETEIITIRNAIGRVLREDIVSTIDIPPNDNSAMDGYAINHVDAISNSSVRLSDNIQEIELSIVGKSFAGSPYNEKLESGQAVRIMTGAKIPNGADAVIMQEQTIINNNEEKVKLLGPATKGQNIRFRGEDINVGKTILTSGTLLTAANIGLLASIGVSEISVTRKINVVIFSTGNELQNVGSKLSEGNIYDSNRYSLIGLLNQSFINIIEKGLLADDKDLIEESLSQISNYADVIITTGGVSVGEADWVKPCIKNIGELIFWRAKIKPGRPILFAKINNALFFGLPGNPVSVMVTFMKFAQIAINKLSGQNIKKSLIVKAKILCDIKKKAGRLEFARGVLSYDDNGDLCVNSYGEQGSGILSSMSIANCFIIIDEDCTGIKAGELVKVEPFSSRI